PLAERGLGRAGAVGDRRAARLLPPLPPEPPLRRQRRARLRRHDQGLVLDLPPRQGRPAGRLLALRAAELLARRDGTAVPGDSPARAEGDGPVRRRGAGAGAVLGRVGVVRLALLRAVLPAV